MKVFITILLVLLGYFGISNIPSYKNISTHSVVDTLPPYGTPYQQIGGKNAMVAINGGGIADTTFVMPRYTDTSQANTTRTQRYGGSMIFTSSDNNFWIRNITATRWIKINGTPSSGSVDSVTSDKVTLLCSDIQSYWVAGNRVAYDTIQIYDGIIKPGVITETSSLHFDVTRFIIRIGCVEHQTPTDTVLILPPADDSLPRIDVIFGNTSNQAGSIQGTPSDNPTPPPVTPNQELALTFVFVSADTSFIIPVPPNLDGRYVKIAYPDTIIAQKTIRDTLIIGPYPLASDNLIIHPGTPINQFAYAIDTVALQQVRANFYQYVKGTSGISVPKYSMFFDGINGTILQLNADKSVTTGNLVGFPGTSNGTISTGGNKMILQSTNSTLHADVQNVGGPLAAGGGMLKVSSGGTTGGANSYTAQFLGNSNLPLLYAGSEQNLGLGTNSPSATASIDIQNPFGVLLPRMTTAVRDGMDDWMTSVTLTNGGSGYTLASPTFTIAGVTGKQPRITCTVIGGIVTALTIDYHGTGIPASGSLVVNNTGTGGSGAAGTFVKSSGNTIATWQSIINTDSSSCPIETWNGSSWIGACGTTGGGFSLTNGSGTTAASTAVNLGGSLTTTVNIDDNSANTHDFNIGRNTLLRNINISSQGDINISTLGTAIVTGVSTSIAAGSVINMTGLLATANVGDSMLVIDVATGNIGYRNRPTGSSGTVTSVGFTAPTTLFTVSGSPITSSGTITGTLTNASAGTLWGNNTASTAAPAYTNAPILGLNGSYAGTLGLKGATSGTVTVTPAAAAGTWTWSLPTTGGTNTYAMTTNGSGVSTWSQINLASAVIGVLPIANGGTNISTYTTGDMLYGSASNVLSKLGIGSSGQVLTVTGGVPVWATPSGGGSDTTVFNPLYFDLTTNPPYDTVSLSSAILDTIRNPVGFYDQVFNNNRTWDLAGASWFVNNSGDGLTYLLINSSGQTTELGTTSANIITDEAAGTVTINSVNGTTVTGGMLHANNKMNIFDGSGNQIMTATIIGGFPYVASGDIDGSYNNTTWYLDDANQVQTFNATSGYSFNGGAVTVANLSAGGIVKAAPSTGLLSIATGTLPQAGSFSGVGTATASFVVTLANTQANNTYQVNVTPTSLLGAAVFYISAKTTTTFTVTYLTGLTGTLTFDYSIYPN